MITEQKNEPDFIKIRNAIAEEDGPADIVFGPDMFDPRITTTDSPYTTAYAHMVESGEIQVNGRTLTAEDMEKPASEIWPGVSDEELSQVLLQHIAETGIMKSVHEFYRVDSDTY